MVNGIRTIYPRGLNKRLGLKFRVGSRVLHETPEEGRRTYRLKRCEYITVKIKTIVLNYLRMIKRIVILNY